jgi:2-polyprenyl-3-methyl-5-hydroxy-6-metoxy-1,4-benzoquinol methylase
MIGFGLNHVSALSRLERDSEHHICVDVATVSARTEITASLKVQDQGVYINEPKAMTTNFVSHHYHDATLNRTALVANTIELNKATIPVPMGSVHDNPPGLTAPVAVFDDLTSAYDQVYSQGTLQTKYVQKLVSRMSPGQPVLDIGCATGVSNGVLLEKAGLKVTGIDSSEKMIKQAKQNVSSGRFILTEAKSFVPSETYDAVVCSLALLSEPSLWVGSLAYRISSWLNPTGLLLFGTIDFNDFPVAPGCPIDPTGLTLRHTFMETSITDSTIEPGDWIKTLRHAGLRLLECDQRIFDPKPGTIEPEPQCFFLASKTAKHALLGPYMHPYKHLAAHRASNANSWISSEGDGSLIRSALPGSRRARGNSTALRTCSRNARKESCGSSWIGCSIWHRRPKSPLQSKPGQSRIRDWKKSCSSKPARAIRPSRSSTRLRASWLQARPSTTALSFPSCCRVCARLDREPTTRVSALIFCQRVWISPICLPPRLWRMSPGSSQTSGLLVFAVRMEILFSRCCKDGSKRLWTSSLRLGRRVLAGLALTAWLSLLM